MNKYLLTLSRHEIRSLQKGLIVLIRVADEDGSDNELVNASILRDVLAKLRRCQKENL